jgi:hypothetical protein
MGRPRVSKGAPFSCLLEDPIWGLLLQQCCSMVRSIRLGQWFGKCLKYLTFKGDGAEKEEKEVARTIQMNRAISAA